MHCRPPQAGDAKRYDSCRSYGDLCRILHRVDRYEGLSVTNLTSERRMTVEWRIHGGTPDWMDDSPEKTALADEVSLLISLLEFEL